MLVIKMAMWYDSFGFRKWKAFERDAVPEGICRYS